MTVRLRAGGLSTFVTADGRLTPVLAGGVRVLDAVYAAVRDPQWNTIPAVVTDLRTGPDEVSFTARHDVGLSWTGRITVAGNRLSFTMDGTVERAFLANRVGFCLLHPIESAGRPVTVRTARGVAHGDFPERIAPHQPFTDITGISYDVGGAVLDITLDGALFEMEDHRNWTDPGFKTYCRPLRLPVPVRHEPGDRIRQSVTMRLSGSPTRPMPASAGSIRIGTRRNGRLPELGFGAAGPSPDAATTDLLRAAGPAFLYAELDLGADWKQTLKNAAAEAGELGVRLDAGLVVPAGADPAPALDALRRLAVRRVFGFDAATGTTSAALAEAIRAAGIPVVGGGSRANFAELNRADLPADRLDRLGYPVTPRVHHDDDRSMLDTLLAQPHTVRDAAVGSGRPVVVGPITLAPRTAGAPDPRQRLPFAAAWTLGAIAALNRAEALTFFTTWGPGGVVDGSPHPVHAVFAALAGWAGTDLLAVHADPRRWAVLALAGGPALIGNLSDRPADAKVNGTTYPLKPYEVRVLPG